MTPAVSISKLHKTYTSGVVALKGVDLHIEEGDFFALLGPNGAGKTTMIGILSGLVKKTEGSVEVFGTSIDADAPKAKTYIGLVPQEFNFNIFAKVIDIVTTQAAHLNIHTSSWFVEYKEFGRVHQTACDHQSALHTAREFLRGLIAFVPEP